MLVLTETIVVDLSCQELSSVSSTVEVIVLQVPENNLQNVWEQNYESVCLTYSDSY